MLNDNQRESCTNLIGCWEFMLLEWQTGYYIFSKNVYTTFNSVYMYSITTTENPILVSRLLTFGKTMHCVLTITNTGTLLTVRTF